MSPAFFRNAGRADRLAVLSALVAIIAVALSTVFTPAAVEAQTPVPQAVCPVGGGCGGQPWLQYRGDAARSGRGIWTHASAEQAAVVWQAQLGSMRASSPVVGSDGLIYLAGPVEDGQDTLVALRPDGGLRWRTPVAGQRLTSTPAIRRDGRLIGTGYSFTPVRDEDGRLMYWDNVAYLYDASPTGVLGLSEARRGAGIASPALDAADQPYVWYPVRYQGISYGYFLESEDADLRPAELGRLDEGLTGSADWTAWFCVAAYISEGAVLGAVAGPGGAVASLAAVAACQLRADFSAAAGGEEPAAPDPGLVPSPALSACSDLVATGWDTLRVRTSGEQLWHKGSSGITTPAVGTAGRAYLPTFDDSHGRLQAWDQDGSRAWQVDFGEYTAATGPPAIGRGSKDSGDTSTTECTSNDRDHRLWDTVDNIYVSVSDGYLYAIDYKGRIRWKQKIGDSLLGPPVVIRQPDDSEVIVAASDWNLLSAFASDGRPLWQLPLDSPARGSPAVAHDRIYVATEKSLYAIGPSSGAPRVGPLNPAATTEPVPTATLAVTPGRQIQPLEPSATPTLPLGPVRGPTATPTSAPRVLFPR